MVGHEVVSMNTLMNVYFMDVCHMRQTKMNKTIDQQTGTASYAFFISNSFTIYYTNESEVSHIYRKYLTSMLKNIESL